MKCRHCSHSLHLSFLDLGSAPPSNAYLTGQTLQAPEVWFPLKLLVCEHCWLVQTADYAGREALFSEDYAYFSSFSTSWLAHSRAYATNMAQRFGLGAASCVVEVAANDGYLLQYFAADGIPCLGVEPTASTAAAARAKGIEIVESFFGEALGAQLSAQGRAADLTAANNVLAHVPDINDFVRGFAKLLKPQGVSTFEFPHLMRMVQGCQFDTAYHEHYSYLSLIAVQAIFARNGLTVFDVEELSTHGGSLRVYAQRSDTGAHAITARVAAVLSAERACGMETSAFYSSFQQEAVRIATELTAFLAEQYRLGNKVAAYGAAAKGNTLLNFAGVRDYLLRFVVDRNPAKAGKYMPGSRVPIVQEQVLRDERPPYVLILPWNLSDEVMAQLHYIREWGGKFVTAVPRLEVR